VLLFIADVKLLFYSFLIDERNADAIKTNPSPQYALSIGGFMRKLNDLFYED